MALKTYLCCTLEQKQIIDSTGYMAPTPLSMNELTNQLYNYVFWNSYTYD